MERVIRFAGCRSGVDQATWGQIALARLMALSAVGSARHNLSCIVDVTTCESAEAALSIVHDLLTRHDSLRTIYSNDEISGLRQVLLGSGEITVPMIELSSEDELNACVTTVSQTMTGQQFDNKQLPIRATLVTIDALPRRLILVLSHMAADGKSLRIIARQALQLSRNEIDVHLADVVQPLDTAKYECSETARARSVAALEFWRTRLEQFPCQYITPRSEQIEVPRFPEFKLQSKALLEACKILSKLCTVSIPAVLYAATVIICKHSFGSPPPLLTTASNRWMYRSMNSVGNYYQRVPIFIDPPMVDFKEASLAAGSELFKAVRHSHYDPRALDKLVARIQYERGGKIDTSCKLLFGVLEDPTHTGDCLKPVELEHLLASTVISRSDGSTEWQETSMRLVLAADGDTVRVRLWIDTALVAADRTAKVLGDLESFLVTLARGEELDIARALATLPS